LNSYSSTGVSEFYPFYSLDGSLERFKDSQLVFTDAGQSYQILIEKPDAADALIVLELTIFGDESLDFLVHG